MNVTRILFLGDQKYWTVCVSDFKSVKVTGILFLDCQKCCTVSVSEPKGANVTAIWVPKTGIRETFMKLSIQLCHEFNWNN